MKATVMRITNKESEARREVALFLSGRCGLASAWWVASVLFFAGAFSGCTLRSHLLGGTSSGSSGTVAPEPPPTLATAGPALKYVAPSGALPSLAPLVKATDASVVTVFSLQEQIGRTGRRRVVMEGLGTGFIYDANGYILTNNHVIAKATDVTVRLADERRAKARVVGKDELTDVAVLKVDLDSLTALALGDSDATEVGDWLVAIGNPFGLSHTVSAGILSAKGRTREELADLDRTGRGYFNFLQTDAAINQGNSGGPLLNLAGQVVGINTAIRANANNIGFAIPINMVRALIPMLVRDGKVTRSAIGITVAGISEDDVARLHLPNRKGAMVSGVQPGGPADRAGLAEEDVIQSFDGQLVDDPESLRWKASIAGVGKTATLQILRGGRTMTLKVVLGALPDAPDPLESQGIP